MNAPFTPAKTMADVLGIVEQAELSETRRRDMTSAINRVCEILGCVPATLRADVVELRDKLNSIRPVRHGIKKKTWRNLRSLFVAALELAGVIESLGRGLALRDPLWAPLLDGVKHDKRLSNALAAFANWCVKNSIAPDAVDDALVQGFSTWLEAKTLHPKPRDLVRRIPHVWNDAAKIVSNWPSVRLTPISFRTPSENLSWSEMNPVLREGVDVYLKTRLEPDLFEEVSNAPARPLAPRSVGQQHKYINYGANALIRAGWERDALSQEALVEIEAFKVILRHFHNKADGKPNAYAINIAKTLIDLARYGVRVDEDHLKELKRLASKLPQVEHGLSEKTKELLRQLECERTRARLLFLPDTLGRECKAAVKRGEVPLVKAEAAVAIEIQLTAPLRPQNLSTLSWSKNFIEPQGPRGPLLLVIPRQDTKTKRRDLTFEIPVEVASTIRWYRQAILPLVGADPNGPLFVTKSGTLKSQETLCQQIEELIEDYVGIHMTVHQFRHVVAVWYLEEHPERFQDMVDLLGHSWAKTTKIYVGDGSRRASKAYNGFIAEKRQAMKLQAKRTRPRAPRR